jgi:hypothetical protein
MRADGVPVAVRAWRQRSSEPPIRVEEELKDLRDHRALVDVDLGEVARAMRVRIKG